MVVLKESLGGRAPHLLLGRPRRHDRPHRDHRV